MGHESVLWVQAAREVQPQSLIIQRSFHDSKVQPRLRSIKTEKEYFQMESWFDCDSLKLTSLSPSTC